MPISQDPQLEDQGEETTIGKENTWNMLAVLRTVIAKEHSTPDPALDVSDKVLALVELGIRSVTWERITRVTNG